MSRVWLLQSDCAMNESLDLSLSPSSQIDLSVVNVFSLYREPVVPSCVFSAVKSDSGFSLQNGLIIFNVSIDLSGAACSEVYISPFDSFNGSLSNVTLTGQIQITNMQTAPSVIKVSSFFGNLLLQGNSAGGQRYVGGPNLKNISSSLYYVINGVNITKDNLNVTVNGTNVTVRLVNEYESSSTGFTPSLNTIIIPTAPSISSLVLNNTIY